jgi:Outer membrane protein beta-barrel domain
MKKILLVSLAMLLAVSAAFSQFGIKGGIDLGTFSGADKSRDGVDPTHETGFAGGISYRIGLIAGLAIQPEVMYIQKGAVYKTDVSDGIYSTSQQATLKIDYIEIPVLIKFNIPLPVVSPYIEGGVSYGIPFLAKEKDEQTTNVPGLTSTSSETNIKHLTKNDFSIVFGIGVDLSILDINARYILGQKKLSDISDAKVFNQGILLTAGLRF